MAVYVPFAVANGESGTGESRALVNKGVNIVKNSDLHFGDFIAGGQKSTYQIEESSGVLIQKKGNAISIGGTHGRASFTAFGSPFAKVRLKVEDNKIDLVRDGGTETMKVDKFSLDGKKDQLLSSTGQATYYIGAELEIGANQVSGSYRGTFAVTIDYQ
ncbi:MAG: DUF4402 domain-containing protein [Gammaproteobacteria bacterium]